MMSGKKNNALFKTVSDDADEIAWSHQYEEETRGLLSAARKQSEVLLAMLNAAWSHATRPVAPLHHLTEEDENDDNDFDIPWTQSEAADVHNNSDDPTITKK
jgi:HAMP domain-containing protein